MIQKNENLLLSVWKDLSLFEKKILRGIGRHVKKSDKRTKVFHLKLTEFGLDKLNPSDITAYLRRLQDKAIPTCLDEDIVYIPLITDMRYDDPKKQVTITFNLLLKEDYVALGSI